MLKDFMIISIQLTGSQSVDLNTIRGVMLIT